MSQLNSRTKTSIANVSIAVALGLGASGAALAYWTSQGNSTGDGMTGTAVDFSISSSPPTGGPLLPDGPAQTVAFTVTNPGAGSLTLFSVVATVAEADGSVWNDVAGCSAADYTVGTPVIVYGDLAAGADVDGDVTVTMHSPGTNQDACQGATVPLYFVAS